MPTNAYFSRDQVRQIDRSAVTDFGLAVAVLMENAGAGAARLLLSLGVRGRVTICAGKGNNGGDGLAMARHLTNAGIPVSVWTTHPPAGLSVEASGQHATLVAVGVPIQVVDGSCIQSGRFQRDLAASDWVVDALLGTGLTRPVGTPFAEVIDDINRSGARVLAVDLPSGMDCDTGKPLGRVVRADHTATFVGPKLGFAQPGAAAWLGRVHVIDIGVPAILLQRITLPDR